jgi:hypothetical protein
MLKNENDTALVSEWGKNFGESLVAQASRLLLQLQARRLRYEAISEHLFSMNNTQIIICNNDEKKYYKHSTFKVKMQGKKANTFPQSCKQVYKLSTAQNCLNLDI